jgi:carbonic anhydrase
MLHLLLTLGLLSLQQAEPQEKPPAPAVTVKKKLPRKTVAVPEAAEEPAPAAGKKAPETAEKKPVHKTAAAEETAEAKAPARKAIHSPAPAPEVEEAPKPTEPPVARKPAPRPRPAAAPSAEQRRLAESEALAARLVASNAAIQQEMARAQGIPFAPVDTPEAALAELKAGNARFVAGRRIRTLLSMQDEELRNTLAKGQAPFAVIVTCSDSRLADNLLFDEELGRLFTIREAGNSPDIQGLASVEYAVEHLGSKVVVVLGHTGCGAVKAVLGAHGQPLPGNLWSLQAAMAGLLESTPEDPNESEAAYADRLASANARRQARGILDRSELVRHLASTGKVKVVPALYSLANGRVSFLELPKAAAPE